MNAMRPRIKEVFVNEPALHTDQSDVTDIRALIELIAKAMVDDPDAVIVEEVAGQRASVFELTVAKPDIGKIVGKQGANLRALEVILSAVGSKVGRKAALEIVE